MVALNNIYDKAKKLLIKFIPVLNAVNYIVVKNNSTTNAPEIQAEGTDADIHLNLKPKGTGHLQWNGNRVALFSEITTSGWLRETMGDADKVMTAGKTMVAITTVFTNNRNLTIPDPSTVPAGYEILIIDEVGALSPGKTLNILRAGAGGLFVNENVGGYWAHPLKTPYAQVKFISNGVNRWNTQIVDTEQSGLQLHRARTHAAITLAGNTARKPSLSNDVQVVITFNLVAADGQTATGTVSVDNSGGGTYQAIAVATNTFSVSGVLGVGGTETIKQSVTFIVPAGSNYKWVASGTGTTTVTSIFELTL
jgi:hypothetical protein